jgi:hypothetical protein
MPMKNPPHPGDFVRTEIIKPAGLSVTAAAAALQVSRPALSSLLNGKADLSGVSTRKTSGESDLGWPVSVVAESRLRVSPRHSPFYCRFQ